MYKFNIGCSLFCFHFNASTFMLFLKSAVDFMKKRNICYLELPVWQGFRVKDSQLVKRLLGNNIKCYSVHFPKTVSIRQLIKDEEFLDAIYDLAPKVIVVHPELKEEFLSVVEQLQEKLPNSIITIEYLPYSRDIKDMLDNMERRYMITLDIFHCKNAGVDWKECMRFYGNRVKHIHVREFPIHIDDKVPDLEIGDLLKTLEESDYSGIMVYESISES